MKSLFHFFGSVHFAICLITASILFVVAGTFIESWTGSHQYAASWTYQHPAFLILLAFFFINILFSALRRWPFQPGHIPFLITHFGLLMIIAGIAVKTVYGTQGVMSLMEGSGSDTLLIPHTRAIRLESKDHAVAYYSLQDKKAPFHLIGYAPNSRETFEYWIKGNQAVVQGLPPFPVYQWEKGREVPVSAKARFTSQEAWSLVAIRTKSAADAAQALYQQGLKEGRAELGYDPLKGFQNPKVVIDGTSIPLQGDRSLVNDQGINLIQEPTLAWIQDHSGDTHFFFFDPYGRVFAKKFLADRLPALAVYDDGFSGYAAIAQIPFYSQSRQEVENQFLDSFQRALDEADPSALAPPLQFIYKTCEAAFSDCVIDLFRHWSHPSEARIPPLDWSEVDQEVYRGIAWATDYLENGGTAADWPLRLSKSPGSSEVTALIQQILSISSQLPVIKQENHAALLKTYLLAYGISPAAIHPSYQFLGIAPRTFTIECPLTFIQKGLAANRKMESNHPIASLKFAHGDVAALAYDASGSGLCRPAANGNYLARFQPAVQKIPYHVRLRNARQVAYANSQQPFSYEADLIIGGEEKKLSMNHVHETWDGYRFYLSSISSPDETEVKKIQVIVNRDPAKYMLTYPGGILVSLGVFLLFWWKPKKRRLTASSSPRTLL